MQQDLVPSLDLLVCENNFWGFTIGMPSRLRAAVQKKLKEEEIFGPWV
jgi:hypothetical protein